MMSLKGLRDRLPNNVGEAAQDSFWTLGFEGCLIITVTSSFLMLGSQLGPAGYGEYVGLFAIITPVSAVGSAASLATLQGLFQDGRPVNRVLATFITLVISAGIVATGIVTLVAPLILDELSMTAIISISVGELVMVPVVRVMAAGIRFISGVPTAVRTQMIMLLGRFAALVGLFALDELTVERVGIGWLISSVVVAFYILLVRLPALGIHLSRGRVSMSDVRMVGALGAPIYVADFQTNGDKLVLNGADLEREAGLYGAAFKIASLALTPMRAMEVATFHRFLGSDENEFGVHLRRAKRYTIWSMGVLAPIALIILVAAPLLEIVVGDDFADSVTMTRWLMLWVPLRALSSAPLAGLLGLSRLGQRLMILIASASISMVLYLLLIPDMGWEGAVIGTVVAEACLAIFGWAALIWSQRKRDEELTAEQAQENAKVPLG